MKKRWTVKAIPKTLDARLRRVQQEPLKQVSEEHFTQINFLRISVEGIWAFSVEQTNNKTPWTGWGLRVGQGKMPAFHTQHSPGPSKKLKAVAPAIIILVCLWGMGGGDRRICKTWRPANPTDTLSLRPFLMTRWKEMTKTQRLSFDSPWIL